MENALLTVAGLPVTPFGAGVALSALVFLCAMGLALARQKLGYGVLVRYAVLALPLGFVLSRLFFVAANYAYYFIEMSNPLLTLYFWDGGYSMSGAIIGFLLGGQVGVFTVLSCFFLGPVISAIAAKFRPWFS